MRISKRQALVLGALVLALGAAAFVAWPSDEDEVVSEVTRVAAAIGVRVGDDDASRADRLAAEVSPRLSDDAVATIGDGAPIVGRAAILAELVRAARGRGSGTVTVSIPSIRIEAERAQLSGSIALSDSEVGDLHRDERRLDVALTRRSDRWLINSITIGRRTHDAPEARP